MKWHLLALYGLGSKFIHGGSLTQQKVVLLRLSFFADIQKASSQYSTKDTRMNSLDLIVAKLKKLAPLSLAGSWDNVGLLVEPSAPKYISKVMLTNDLTAAVMEEAKDKTVDLIISYHPPIFAPMKRLTQNSWKERLVIDCMENRIGIFSPHTSYDAVKGGVNDWLLAAFEVKKETVAPVEVTKEFPDGLTHVLEIDLDPAKLKEFRDECLLNFPPESRLRQNKEAFTMHSVKPGIITAKDQLRLRVECNETELMDMVKGLVVSGCKEKYTVSQLSKVPRPEVGMGRKAKLATPISLQLAITRVKGHLKLKNVSVARAVGKKDDDEIETVAVCAGSGSSVLRGVTADLLVTGEMSHHDVLDAVHHGSSVILCHHSNTERGYLKYLQGQLTTLFGSSIEVFLAETDQDPLEIV